MIAGEVWIIALTRSALQELLLFRNVSVIYREVRKLPRRRAQTDPYAPAVSGEVLLCSPAAFRGNCYRFRGHNLQRIGSRNPGQHFVGGVLDAGGRAMKLARSLGRNLAQQVTVPHGC